MQPAYYENLEEIQNKYWSMLDDAVTNRTSSFRIPVFMSVNQDEIDGRIVVLRKSNRGNNLLQFHTDFRSPKVNILMKNNKASLLFYDKEEKIQLRVKVDCEVNNQNSITEESWKKTQHISRRCYLTDSPPGTKSENPTSGMISKLEDLIIQWNKVKMVTKTLLLSNVKLNLLSGYTLQQKDIAEPNLI